jgi:hypothetical protein
MTRGHIVDRATQYWVQLTGRRVEPTRQLWLDGPAGTSGEVGPDFFESYAPKQGLSLQRTAAAGLLQSFGALTSARFDAARVDPAIVAFYEETSLYDLDVWSEWCGLFRPFGWVLAVVFSRRLKQLNVPLSSLDTSLGMTSDVVPIAGATDGVVAFTAWIRTLKANGRVVYSGAYYVCTLDAAGPCLRVVFPLPNGNATVIMSPMANEDGSLTLLSSGRTFGDPGFYFTVHDGDSISARYVRTFRERIHVYADGRDVRADHVLRVWGFGFLRLHYRLRRRREAPEA